MALSTWKVMADDETPHAAEVPLLLQLLHTEAYYTAVADSASFT